MKKYLFIVLAVTAIGYVGCKKDSGSKGPTDSYLPVTAGSTWVYGTNTEYSEDTLTVTMNSGTTTTNGKQYYTATSTSRHEGSAGIFFYEGNHIYTMRMYDAYANTVVELELYNDTAKVNSSWINKPTDDGTINTYPAREVNTIVATGLTKVFSGKTYNNVVHVLADVQYNYGVGYTSSYTYDFYLAKGIGIIGYTQSALGQFVQDESIISSSVK